MIKVVPLGQKAAMYAILNTEEAECSCHNHSGLGENDRFLFTLLTKDRESHSLSQVWLTYVLL